MQNFMQDAPFDESRMLATYKNHPDILSARVSHPGGMLSCDGTENVKKGKNWVGVRHSMYGRETRQEIENCQSMVTIGYASDRGYGLVDYQAVHAPEVVHQRVQRPTV